MNSYFLQALFMKAMAKRTIGISPFFEEKGASGSWAEPYFACPTLRCGEFTYPPGIL